MDTTRKFFHYISYLQYPLICVAVFYVIQPYFNEFDRFFESLNKMLLFMGLSISFSTLQDTTKTQNEVSRKIWQDPVKGKIFLTIIGLLTLFFIVTGIFGLFMQTDKVLNEISLGLLVLGIGLVGLLKSASEMFDNHRLDLKSSISEYSFDRIVDRERTNAMSVEGYRGYLFDKSVELTNPYDDYIRMWVADMEFEIAPEIKSAIKRRVDRGVVGYTKVFDPNFLEAFCAWTQHHYNFQFKKEHIVQAAGVIPALFDISGYICEEGDKILIFTPSYAFFKHAANFNNIELVTSDLIYENGEWRMDFTDFEKKANDSAVKLCIFCSPHNPTGRVWKDEELKRFGEICLQNNIFILSDEIHCDLLRSGIQFTPLAKLFPDTDKIITCMAPSKTFSLAGMMIANIVIPNEELMNKWNSKIYRMDNPLSIAAAQAAYTEGYSWLNSLKGYLDDNFKYLDNFLKENLPKAKFTIPEATYLAWVNLNGYFSKDENLTLFFANNAGVLLEGGNMFVSNADGFIRLNLACPKSRLKEGLTRIKKAIINRDN